MTHIIKLHHIVELYNGYIIGSIAAAYGALSSSDPSVRLVTLDDIVRFIDHGEISDNFQLVDFDRPDSDDSSFTCSITRRTSFYVDKVSLMMPAPANRDLIAAWLYHRDEWVRHLKIPLVILPEDNGPFINVIHNGYYVVKNSDSDSNSDEMLDHLPDKYIPIFHTCCRMKAPHTYTGSMKEGLQIHVPGHSDNLEKWELDNHTVDLMRDTNYSTFRITKYPVPNFTLSTDSVSDEIGEWCDGILTATDDMSYNERFEYYRKRMHEFDFEEVCPGLWIRLDIPDTNVELPNILL